MYDDDILEWSEQQAALLRRVAAGAPVNAAVDWANVIEEVESVGRSELRACESLLRQALVHLLKMRAWPASKSNAHWRAELRRFLFGAYRASMRGKIDIAGLYSDALQALPDVMDGQAPLPVPGVCPVTLDEVMAVP